MLFENAYLSRPGETMTHVLDWCVRVAMEFVCTLDIPEVVRLEALLRKGSCQAE